MISLAQIDFGPVYGEVPELVLDDRSGIPLLASPAMRAIRNLVLKIARLSLCVSNLSLATHYLLLSSIMSKL